MLKYVLLVTSTVKKKLVTFPRGGHNNIQDIDPKKFWGSIRDFLSEK